MPNSQYYDFPAGRYANGEAMPQALRSVQVPNSPHCTKPARKARTAA
jgi:hypothetical protein